MQTTEDDPLTTLLAWVRPRFHADAACREHPELNWYPERGESTREQRQVCASCLVREECSAAAQLETFGFWAGETARARRLARSVTPREGPRPRTAERLKVIAAMRSRNASSEAIAARLGITLGALNSLERKYQRPAA